MPLSGTAWALLPPMTALVVAFASRRVLLALGTAALVGFALLGVDALGATGLLLAPVAFVRDGVLGQATTPSNAQVLVLVALISGFVRLYETSGAARALVGGLGRIVTTPRRAEAAAWLGGLALFFSDTGNVLILGPVFRPVFDRLGVARERLAWIVDATAAPVSVLVPFITWGVYVIGLIDASFGGERGIELFVGAWRFQLYPVLSLGFVAAMAAFGRHWGPMAAVAPPDAVSGDAVDEGSVWVGVLPLVALFLVLGGVGAWAWASEGILKGPSVRLALGCAYLAAIGVLAALLRGREASPTSEVLAGMGGSMRLLILLVFAWSLGSVCKDLGTGMVVAGALGPWVPVFLLPLAVFVTGAIVSFATGTSWGTFAILIPIAASLSTASGVAPELLVGAVLSGGVFGDHSSPISDTTLLASAATGVEHDAHVRTQLPYAAAVGAASAVGFIVAGLGGGGGGLLAGAVVVLAVVLWSRGR